MGDSTKMIVKLVVVGGAAYFLYYWLNKNGLWQQWFGSTPAPATTTTTATAPGATTTTGTPPTPPPAPALASSPAYLQAIAAIKTASGNAATETFDGWSYYWQNAPTFQGAPLGFGQSGSISPHLFGAVVAAGGGDNTAQITAETFVNLLAAQQAQGISGLAWFGSPDWTREQQARGRNAARFLPDYAGWVN